MSTTIEQAPGWWPNLIRAACECGWRGPTRNAYEPGEMAGARRDALEHENEH